MPIREFSCQTHKKRVEVIHPSLDPETVPPPVCAICQAKMELLISLPRIDTSATFKAFRWRGPDGIYHNIDNLHKLRAVEHSYLATGHNVRFDAYSAEPSNPDPVDGFGPTHRTHETDEKPTTTTVSMKTTKTKSTRKRKAKK